MAEENDFEKAAEEFAKGKEYRPAAAAALAGALTTAATGHPILGGVAAGATHRIATALLDTAEQRMLAAGVELDEKRAERSAVARRVREELRPVFQALQAQHAHQLFELVEWMRSSLAEPMQEVVRILAAVESQRSSDCELLAAYRAYLRAEHSRPPGLFNDALTDLDTVFIELDVDEEESREGRGRQGHTLRSLMQAPRRVPGYANRWVVRGHPGSGKSTLARHLVWELAGEENGPIPVYATLPELAASEQKPFEQVEEYFQKGWNESVSAHELRDLLVRISRAGREVWLFLDGLDEVTEAQRTFVDRNLRLWATSLPDVTIALFSRIVGYRTPDATFKAKAILRELGEPKQRELLARWLPETDVRRALDQLRSSAALRDACRVPLLLSLFAFLIQQGGEVPASRRGLFHQGIDVLLTRGHDHRRGLGVKNAAEARTLLGELSLELQARPGEAWPREALEAWVENLPAAAKHFPARWAVAGAFLDDLSSKSGVLAPFEKPNWRFFHRQFRELLAAEALHQRRAVLAKARELEAKPKLLPRWAEVLGFACEMAEQPLALLKQLHTVSEELALRVLPELGETVDLVTALDRLRRDGNWDGDFLRRLIDRWSEAPGFDAVHVARWLLGQVSPGRPIERLAHLYYALEHLETKRGVNLSDLLDGKSLREGFFRRCERWPEGGPKEPELVRIPAGSFVMGSPPTEAGRFDDEGPQHSMGVSEFWLAPAPVTNAEYVEFDDAHRGERFRGKVSPEDVREHPVVDVSWWEAFLYTRWRGGRLPTEAEWEYACRAGTTSAFNDGSECTEPNGDDPALRKLGWFQANSGHQTHKVKQLEPNQWGLYDLHGNVWEWCSDWFGGYGESNVVDPQGPEEGQSRVLRGGSWISSARDARSADRDALAPDVRSGSFGFRFARGHR